MESKPVIDRAIFNRTIPVSLKISQSQLDFLKKRFIPENPTTEIEIKYKDYLKRFDESELCQFLVGLAVKEIVQNQVNDNLKTLLKNE